MAESSSEPFFKTPNNKVLVCLVLPVLLFAFFKVALNANWFGTDTVRPIVKQQLKHIGSRLAYAPPFKVFGDLTDGMFPAAKVYEDGARLGVSVDWHGDLFQSGMGRTFHQEHIPAFSTSDNSHPMENGRSYSVAYNPLAWLNQDWISAGVLFAAWLVLGMFKDNAAARKLRGSASPWLLFFLVDRFLTILSSPNFALSTVPDSGSYAWMAGKAVSLEAALSHFRTVGYPLFYAIVPDVLIPAVQLAVFFVAVSVLYAGLRAISGKQWVALAACLPMVTLNNTYRLDPIAYSHLLIPDALTLSVGMLAVGTCLLFLAETGRRWLWLTLCGIATFYAYMLKPSYLFLVASMPIIVLGWVVLCRLADWKYALRRAFLPVTLVVVVPLLLFCGLRWTVVDQFSLVSAGGRQLIGLAGNFLDEETVSQVSKDLRPFASDIAEIVREKDALAPSGADGESLYKHIFRTYDWIIYGNGELSQYCSGIECDEKLGALSREILILNMGQYLTWLQASAANAMEKVMMPGRWGMIVQFGFLCGVAFFVVAAVRAKEKMPLKESMVGLFGCDMRLFLWILICLTASSLLVVILVAIPYSRYLLPTKILVLPLCMFVIASLIHGGVTLWKSVPESK